MAQTTLNLRIRWPLRRRLIFWLLCQWVRVGAMFPDGAVRVTIAPGASGLEYFDAKRKAWRPLCQ